MVDSYLIPNGETSFDNIRHYTQEVQKVLEYKIIKELAVLSSKNDSKKTACVVSWNNAAPKLDIRTWFTADGKQLPSKGITFTTEEAVILHDAIAAYLEFVTQDA